MAKGPGSRHTMVLKLEPKRAAIAVGCTFMAVLATAVIVATFNYPEIWPRPDHPDISDRALSIIAAVAGFVALAFALGAISNVRRWRTAKAIKGLSNDPTLSSFMPRAELAQPTIPSHTIPPLQIRIERPRKFDKGAATLRQVTPEANVVGYPPLQILYLRLFDNQPRMRTFIEGAWREFGYVYMLRSATSVTPHEFREAKARRGFDHLFVDSDEELWAFVDECGSQPAPKGRYTFRNIAPTKIRVRDKFGAYPARAVLCHGSFWQAAVTRLLPKMDLVALDLSGFTEANAGTRFELQRVLNTFPIERVVFLADVNTNTKFIETQLKLAWAQMPDGSPNATLRTRTAVIAETDLLVQTMSNDGPSTQTNMQLRSRRAQTRQVALNAQQRIMTLYRTRADASVRAVGYVDNQTRG